MAPLTGDPAAQTDRPRVEDAVHSPEDIAARLRLPPPTEEQAEVVTAPLTPRLVLGLKAMFGNLIPPPPPPPPPGF